jgi:hypothetical protein
MASDTATLVLKGSINLRDYTIALEGLTDLVKSLAADVASGAEIEWEITSLEAASAHTTVRGIAKEGWSEAGVERVVSAYHEVAAAMSAGQPIPYSVQVREAAYKITSVLKNPKVKSIVFETEADDVEVFGQGVNLPSVKKGKPHLVQVCHGAVRGRVQSLTNRHALRFTLYDLLHDNAVSCYLLPGSESKMREAWGRLAIVEGILRRDPFTGHPTSIREIKDVHILSDRVGTWRDAAGVAPAKPGSISPEEAIRRARNG